MTKNYTNPQPISTELATVADSPRQKISCLLQVVATGPRLSAIQ